MPLSGTQHSSALTLQVLGGFRLQDGAGQDIRIASRKGRALLAWLALRPDEAHARDRLASLLWEDADEDLARSSLRQALAALRRSLPAACSGLLRGEAETLLLNSAFLRTDIKSLHDGLQAQNRATLQTALTHYRGELLEGLDARSGAFDEWLSTERQALRRRIIDSLQRLTALCAAHQDDDGELAASLRLLSLEPLNEAAHRNVMLLHARHGALAEALRQYKVCRDALRRELDVSPEPATDTLYRDLMRRRRSTHEAIEADDREEEAPSAPAGSNGTQAAPNETRIGLRDAVVLVARFEGLLELEASIDPEEVHRVSASLQRLVQQAAQEFGGVADRRVGAAVVAAFGIPAAYGNESERAARAALLLREFVNATPLPADIRLRIGIAHGQIINSSEVFPLTGRPVHQAHALAARAEDNEILLSDDLRQSLGERVDVQRTTLPEGASPDTSSAWTLRTMRTSDAAGKRIFVGRRPELAMILASLDRCAASRHGRAIVLRGEAGIGKTRLADAVCAAGVERGLATHSAQVFDFGQSPGRRPITLLALSLLGLAADASPPARAAAIEKMLDGSGADFDRRIFLSALIDAPLNQELAALEQAMDVATRQRGRTQSLAHLIETASQHRPLLLLVEDVHWADNDELARLGEIAAVVANCPALLLMTTRPEGDPTGAAWRARARGCPVTTIDLSPLAEDEAQELAKQYPELSAATIAACIRRAEGLPLFLDQLLRAAGSGCDSLPASVRTLVVSRADTLSAIDHDALKAAAVLGHRLPLAALRDLIDDPTYAPAPLIEAALLRIEGADLLFAHALFRDAIYESTLKTHRRNLHLRAAAWFHERDAALHADHLAAADHENAAATYLVAAEAEAKALRFERALTLAGKSYALARAPRLLLQVSCLLGELQLQLGRTHDALASYREALDFSLDHAGKGRALLGVAAALRIMDRHEEALDALDRAESALAEDDDLRVKARLYTLRGNLCFPLGRVDACLRSHERALDFARSANSHADIARAYGGIGDAWYQRGYMLTANAKFAQCVDEARRHGSTDVLVANLPMLAITRTYGGDAASGQPYFDEALELVRRIGDVRGELLVHLGVAAALLVQGRMLESRGRAQRAFELAKTLGARRFEAESLGVLGATYLDQGPNAEALQLIQQGIALARNTAMTYCGPVLLSLAARATSDSDRCKVYLAEGEILLAQGCVSHSYFEYYGNAIEVSLRNGEIGEARRYADALERYTQGEPCPWTDLVIRRTRALADVIENASAAAFDTLRGVRETCEQMRVKSLLPFIDRTLGGDAARGSELCPRPN